MLKIFFRYFTWNSPRNYSQNISRTSVSLSSSEVLRIFFWDVSRDISRVCFRDSFRHILVIYSEIPTALFPGEFLHSPRIFQGIPLHELVGIFQRFSAAIFETNISKILLGNPSEYIQNTRNSCKNFTTNFPRNTNRDIFLEFFKLL